MRKIAIMLRVGLNAEALNNEGNIGNVMQPRQIELYDNTIRNALSGIMLKHFHHKNLRLLANEDEICSTCRIFSPMKNGVVDNIDTNFSISGNKVKNCIVDDIEGFMDAGGTNSKRTSVIKFSWGIGVEENDYISVLHNRIDPTEKNNKKREDNKKDKKTKNTNEQSETTIEEDTTSDANTNQKQNTQMIFYKPLRCDEYAITIQIDLDRIGFDDERLIYTLPEEKIKERQKKCIKALTNMFLDMEGAMCSTSLPHVMSIEGVLVDKTDKNDVLVKYSALNKDYKEINEKIANKSTIFNNIEEFVKTMNDLT